MKVGEKLEGYECIKSWVQENGKCGHILRHPTLKFALIAAYDYVPTEVELREYLLRRGPTAEKQFMELSK